MPALMAQREPEQKKYLQDLSSPSLMEEYFLSLYPRRDVYIQKLPGQAKWNQNKKLLQDFQLLGVIEDEGRGLWRGCYWAEQTKFAVLDIDAGSSYHCAQELKKLREILEDVNLTDTGYRSSESGGWHLYISFDDWVSSKDVEVNLKQFFKSKGYEIKGGQLEIFPSGNALRLPLQPGFAWLNESGEVETRREELERDEALRRFLTDLKTKENNWSEAKALITTELTQYREIQKAQHKLTISMEGFDDLFSERGKIQEVWELGQRLWLNGLEKKGQRHDGVLAVGHYLWYGDPDRRIPAYPGTKYDRARAKLIEAWLEKKHNGYCRHINEGRWDIVREQITRATVWREKSKPVIREPYPLTERLLERLLEVYRMTGQLWEIPRLEAANNAREEEARERIKEAVDWVLENGAPLTISEVARVAGAHRKTVKKNIDLLETRACVFITSGGGGVLAAPEDLNEVDQFCSGEKNPDKKNILPFPGESEDSAPGGSAVVAPRSSSQAEKPITRPQCQNQELRNWLDVLTPGPWQRDIEAGTAGSPGGILEIGTATIRVKSSSLPKRVYSGTSHIDTKSTLKVLGKSQKMIEFPAGFESFFFRRDPDRAARLDFKFAPGLLTKSGISKQIEEDLKASSGAAWHEPHLNNYFRLNLVCYFRDKQNKERNKRGRDRSNQPEFDLISPNYRCRGPPRRKKRN